MKTRRVDDGCMIAYNLQRNAHHTCVRKAGADAVRVRTRAKISRASIKPVVCAPKPTRKCAGASKQSPGATRTPSWASASHNARESDASTHQGNATVPPPGRTQPSFFACEL